MMRVRLGILLKIYLFPQFKVGVVSTDSNRKLAVKTRCGELLSSFDRPLHCVVFVCCWVFYTRLHDAGLVTKILLKDEALPMVLGVTQRRLRVEFFAG